MLKDPRKKKGRRFLEGSSCWRRAAPRLKPASETVRDDAWGQGGIAARKGARERKPRPTQRKKGKKRGIVMQSREKTGSEGSGKLSLPVNSKRILVGKGVERKKKAQ